jgi:hypothetical protein
MLDDRCISIYKVCFLLYECCKRLLAVDYRDTLPFIVLEFVVNYLFKNQAKAFCTSFFFVNWLFCASEAHLHCRIYWPVVIDGVSFFDIIEPELCFGHDSVAERHGHSLDLDFIGFGCSDSHSTCQLNDA